MPFKEDKVLLGDILREIGRILELYVREQIREDRELFESVWFNEIRPRLERLIETIEAIPSEQSTQWRELQDHGLTGAQLGLKSTRFRRVVGRGIRKKILEIINTILSSIPGADAIREYKEFVEEAVD